MGEYALHPLAYLITYTTYGARLHGDERGTVDRYRNQPGAPVIPAFVERHRRELAALTDAVFTLDAPRREVVRCAIENACAHRHWRMHALNVRTNHVHAVVTAPIAPEPVMSVFKAWSTRRLREANLVGAQCRLWTRHGSTSYLWKTDQVTSACQYVVEGQGDDLPSEA